MQLITEYATPAELTGYAREALRDREENQFGLERWLPNDTVNDLSYRFTRGGGGLTEAATYRAYDAESDIATREGGARVSGELPPMSRKLPVGEYERIKRRNVDSQREEIRNAMMSDSEKLVDQLRARVELARGAALFGAAVNLNENNVQGGVDFGRNPAHSVTAATLWSDLTNSKPLDDLQAWMDVYNDTNGTLPRYVMMSRQIYNLLRRSAQLTKLSTTGATAPGVLTKSGLETLLSDYDVPEIVIYDAKVSVGGSATRITPQDKICFLPEQGPSAGRTLWGVPVEADDPRYGLGGSEAGIAVGAYKSEDPQTVWTRATAIVLPVVAAPDLTFQADVL
ncbi:major capsid protein [Streptomyces asiaticus]|uniref:major capsid protein n=1 Tax=Streptomyces asiaticus TaxID=114695 RepID=UPI001BA4B5F3|nr:major capsid protein [Streptomyces asiaticus]